MVTTRRRIVNEQDRFGGFNGQPSRNSSATTETDETEITFTSRGNFDADDFVVTNSLDSNVFPPQVRRASIAKQEVKAQPVVEYSSRQEYPQTAEYVGPVAAPRIAYKPKRREREEVMPSIKTQAYIQPEQEQQVKPHAKQKSKISVKNRMALAIYMVVISVLAVIVIATGIAVSNIGGEVNALESQIIQKNQYVMQQTAQIDKVTDKAYIAGKALENGMEKVTSVVELKLIPTVDPITYEKRTNWFDQFCNWVSKIIGG